MLYPRSSRDIGYIHPGIGQLGSNCHFEIIGFINRKVQKTSYIYIVYNSIVSYNRKGCQSLVGEAIYACLSGCHLI